MRFFRQDLWILYVKYFLFSLNTDSIQYNTANLKINCILEKKIVLLITKAAITSQ